MDVSYTECECQGRISSSYALLLREGGGDQESVPIVSDGEDDSEGFSVELAIYLAIAVAIILLVAVIVQVRDLLHLTKLRIIWYFDSHIIIMCL